MDRTHIIRHEGLLKVIIEGKNYGGRSRNKSKKYRDREMKLTAYYKNIFEKKKRMRKMKFNDSIYTQILRKVKLTLFVAHSKTL